MFDVCIIGGGASGMASAIAIKNINMDMSVCILEKKDALGKKLMATGNGKCNLTNVSCPEYEETLAFFQAMGIETRADSEGRVYPYSEDASQVVKAMVKRLEFMGVEVMTGVSVSNVRRDEKDKLFLINREQGEAIQAKSVVIATGGKAGPQFGSTGDGYGIAKSLGHHVTRLAPALAGIETIEDLSDLAGIRAKAEVTLVRVASDVDKCGSEKFDVIFCEPGEVQFTKDGLSGICIFNMSRYLKLEEGKTLADGFKDYEVRVNFLPDKEFARDGKASKERACEILAERRHLLGMGAGDLLQTIVREPLALDVLTRAEAAAGSQVKAGGDHEEMILRAAKALTDKEIEAIAQVLTCWKCHVKGVKGWNFAQVTAGGVELGEMDLNTMESRLVPGLYFTGEVIDYDGPCGGFNLQNAWTTAMRAGRAIAQGR